jgi:hypothetical protein
LFNISDPDCVRNNVLCAFNWLNKQNFTIYRVVIDNSTSTSLGISLYGNVNINCFEREIKLFNKNIQTFLFISNNGIEFNKNTNKKIVLPYGRDFTGIKTRLSSFEEDSSSGDYLPKDPYENQIYTCLPQFPKYLCTSSFTSPIYKKFSLINFYNC